MSKPIDVQKEMECTCDPMYAHHCWKCGGRGWVPKTEEMLRTENQSLRTMRDNELFDAQEELKVLRERLRQREAELEQRTHCQHCVCSCTECRLAQPLPSPPKVQP